MFKEKTIGVIVPAYNEGKLINKTLNTIPDFVDTVIVINDGSKDNTLERIEECKIKDKRIIILNHKKNKGLGQTLIDGYIKARELEIDIIAIMAGDAQMDPNDLPNIIEPIAKGECDYTKGNRLLHDQVTKKMPKYRYIGNTILTILTKFATGYWYIMDPQSGYTAISKKALSTIPIERMIKGYGYNAHILNMLNLDYYKVKDVEIEPVYGEEKSKIKLSRYIKKVSWLLLKLFFKRINRKYLVRDFNPLVLFYYFGIIDFVLLVIPMLIRFFIIFFSTGVAPTTTLTILVFSTMMFFFFIFFGMWFDMEDNRKLKP